MTSLGVRVPDGFATTADAYRRFLGETGLADRIAAMPYDEILKTRVAFGKTLGEHEGVSFMLADNHMDIARQFGYYGVLSLGVASPSDADAIVERALASGTW